MSDIIMNSIIASRREIARRIQAEIGTVRKGEAISAATSPAKSQDAVARLKAQLAATREARDKAVRRYEAEMGRIKNRLERMESQIREQKAIKAAEPRPSPLKNPAAPPQPATPAPVAKKAK